MSPLCLQFVLKALEVGDVEQPERDLAERLLTDASFERVAWDRFVIFHPVCPHTLRLLFDPAFEVAFDSHVRRGEILGRPE